MFIDFEGVEGSGRAELSRRVADRLRARGDRVCFAGEAAIRDEGGHVPPGSARAQVLASLAAQTRCIDERVRPALGRGELCIAEGLLHGVTAEAMAAGLPAKELSALTAFASDGLVPDLVVLVDVDPELARLRVEAAGEDRLGLREVRDAARQAAALRELARRDPARWAVVDGEDVSLAELAERVADLVVTRLEVGAPEIRLLNAPRPVRPRVGVEEVEGALLEAVDALLAREPSVALHLLRGLGGIAAHARRVGQVEAHPAEVARSLIGLDDEESFRLREIARWEAPAAVARSLTGDPSARAAEMREALFDRAPDAVVRGLVGDDSAAAWALRTQALSRGAGILGAVLCGLEGVDGDRAWELRREGRALSLDLEVARSLGGLRTARADAARESLAMKAPLEVLRSLRGVDTASGRILRERLLGSAPAAVLRSLVGIDAPWAWAMRAGAAAEHPEAVASVEGMDGPEAWTMRERGAQRWPCAALDSLGGLGGSDRGRALVEGVLAAQPGRLTVWRSACAALEAANRRPKPGLSPARWSDQAHPGPSEAEAS